MTTGNETDIHGTEDIVARLMRLADMEMNDLSRDINGVIPRAMWDAKKEIEHLRGVLRGIASCTQLQACVLCRDLLKPYLPSTRRSPQ